jgi:TolB-like protein
MRLGQINSLACATMFVVFSLCAAGGSSAATKVLVLPLRSVGEPGHYDWISQAIAEDLQSEARQNSNVQVLSTPSGSIEATAEASQAAGKQAGADITIFGTFQVVSDMLRVNCTAIDANGQTLTSPAATGAVRDLFVIEDKLAAEINRVLPPRPGADASATTQPPAPYPYTNPNMITIPGLIDTTPAGAAPAPAPTGQANDTFYYPATSQVYYLPEYSMPPVYYPEAPSYCYTTWEPFYDDFYLVPGLTFYGGVGYVGGGGLDRGRFRINGNVGINGGGFSGGRSTGSINRPTQAGILRPPLPPWGNAPTPLGFRSTPLGAGGNPAHLGGVGGLGVGRR